MTPAPLALLQRWYSLVREKRAARNEYLKQLTKVFDVEVASSKLVYFVRVCRFHVIADRIILGRRCFHAVYG